MATQLGAPRPVKGYVYEIQYHEVGEDGREGDRHPYRSYMPSTRRVFVPWPDPRPAIEALEISVVNENRKGVELAIADAPRGGEFFYTTIVRAIEVISATRVAAVDEIFGFDFSPSYSPFPPTAVGVAP